jgi:hypothetical protein
MMLYLLRFKSKMLLAEVTKRDYKTRCNYLRDDRIY